MPIATPLDRLEGYTWSLIRDGSADDSPYNMRALAMTLVARQTWAVRADIDASVGLAIGMERNGVFPNHLSGIVGVSLALLERGEKSLVEKFEDPRRSLEVHRINPTQFDSIRPPDLETPVAFTMVTMRERLLKTGDDFRHPVMEQFRTVEQEINRNMPLRNRTRALSAPQRKLLFLLALLGSKGYIPTSMGNSATVLNRKAVQMLQTHMAKIPTQYGAVQRVSKPDGSPGERFRVSSQFIQALGGRAALHAFMEETVGFEPELWREAVEIHFKTREELQALAKEAEKEWPPEPSNGTGMNGIELNSRTCYRLKKKFNRCYLSEFRHSKFQWTTEAGRALSDRGIDSALCALFKTVLDGRERIIPLRLDHIEAIARS